MKRRRLAEGIFADAYGVQVLWHEHGRQRSKRFKRSTSLERMVEWRKNQIDLAKASSPATPRGSLARDLVRFLKTRKGRAGYRAEKAHLKAWLQALGNVTRRRITRLQLEQAIADWRQAGYSAQTIRHRVRVFRQLFRTLDNVHEISAFEHLALPPKPKPRPVSVSDALIRAVALELVKHEIAHQLHSPKTRARFLVLASTGHRPSEIKRAQPQDLDLERRLWFVRGAKGGEHATVYLNDDMLAAWQLFITAKAWGSFDTRNFARVLRRCGWPKGVRPYTLRHSTGLALSERGADLGDIQAHLGHASIETTRSFYVPAIDSRRMATSQLLEGRIGQEAFRTVTPDRHRDRQRKAKHSGQKSA